LPGRSFFGLRRFFRFVVEGLFSRGFWGKGIFWCGDFVVKVW
jgi:hypothetical protein